MNFLCNLQDPAVLAIIVAAIGLLGVLAGSLISFGAQMYIEHTKRVARTKSLSAAFYGEINSLLRLAKQRNYLDIFDNALAYIQTNNSYPHIDAFLSMQFDDYFAVYRHNIQYIGELDPKITPLLTEFYQRVFSLMEDMTKIPGAHLQQARQMCPSEEEAEKVYLANLI